MYENRFVLLPYLRYFLKRGDKVVVTDDGQSVEHVDGLQTERGHTLTHPAFL